MKTFLNVLYRRILYKIPLKLLLVLLAVFAILFACFSKADTVEDLITNISSYNTSINANSTLQVYNNQGDFATYCIKILSISNAGGNTSIPLRFGYSYDGSYNSNNSFSVYTDWSTPMYMCIFANRDYIYLYNGNSQKININYEFFKLNALFNTQIPVYTSLECQTEYNLIPISSVDQNYCITNNLCPSVPDNPNIGTSNIFINDIFHPGAFNIIMNIPEEIDWDYAYTNSGQNFNIDVVGYNVDFEKVQSVIDLQNYKPTDDDFSEIISVLAPYSKIIIFFIVLFSLWAMIKKPFKSKKL